MGFRIANKKDLPVLENMFKDIAENMDKKGITIWNEFYPYEEFASDIENENLYLIIHEDKIAAVFGVFDSVGGEECFEWKDNGANASYLGRVGVNVKYRRQGFGKLILEHALEVTRERDAKFLRLLVSDINKPAINFYRKSGFTQVEGIYNEFSELLNKNIVEFGFEKER